MRGGDKEMSVEDKVEQKRTEGEGWAESAWGEWFDRWIRGECAAGSNSRTKQQTGRKETQAWQQQ